MFAVIDCNNFFVSCERVFNPKLKSKPIVVASSNDGVIVARSNEVKKLGIPMGAKAYEWRDTIDRYQIQIFSGNFPLYGDLSRRVMQTIAELAPDIEVYSIDEAFLDLTNFHTNDVVGYGQMLKDTVYGWIGVPVSVGIGPTKTLAKAAVEIAKKNEQFNGVSSAYTDDFDDWLKTMPVKDIWGVGRSYSAFLKRNGVFNARDFKYVSDTWVKQNMKVIGQRTLLEMRGIPCMGVAAQRSARKGIISSRTFGRPVTNLKEMREAVAMYAARAAERLRNDGSIVSKVQVLITTNRHRKDIPQYSNVGSFRLGQPTNYTPSIISAAKRIVETIYKDGFSYKKAMVMLGEISPSSQVQLNLFQEFRDDKRDRELMKAIDVLNRKWGKSTMLYAATGIPDRRGWKTNAAMLSRRYTTSWQEIPVVKT
ncbi:MAG: Y-family DNA polymerase [Candidatus Dojkabacteria bacterium]